ncbi:hypothetical protein T11_2971 [Trichinella zimbabwensis]|uniref:Uncharacterized protein n=1 Tax=Trichinella zimbabwensis TaxID=268475 RepID=A0A0V1H146_9BILA|nr:hypothetical protein T11_2971 [Trichinella zimbabwensis]
MRNMQSRLDGPFEWSAFWKIMPFNRRQLRNNRPAKPLANDSHSTPQVNLDENRKRQLTQQIEKQQVQHIGRDDYSRNDERNAQRYTECNNQATKRMLKMLSARDKQRHGFFPSRALSIPILINRRWPAMN